MPKLRARRTPPPSGDGKKRYARRAAAETARIRNLAVAEVEEEEGMGRRRGGSRAKATSHAGAASAAGDDDDGDGDDDVLVVDDAAGLDCDASGCDETFSDEEQLRVHWESVHGVFEIETVLRHRKSSRGLEFFVKWKGYSDPKCNSWEPEEGVGHIDAVKDYVRRCVKPKQRSPPSAAHTPAEGKSRVAPRRKPTPASKGKGKAVRAAKAGSSRKRSMPITPSTGSSGGASPSMSAASSASGLASSDECADAAGGSGNDDGDASGMDVDGDDEGDGDNGYAGLNTESSEDESGDGAGAARHVRVSKRKRKSRLISVGRHKVLRSNNYDIEEGYIKSAPDLPPKPKGALQPFQAFGKIFRADNQEKLKGLPLKDQLKMTADAWRDLTPAGRVRAEAAAAADKARFDAEMEKWEADSAAARASFESSLADDERRQLAEAREAAKRRRARTLVVKRVKPAKKKQSGDGVSAVLSAHNREIVAAIEAKAGTKHAFLREHLKALNPFISDKAARSLGGPGRAVTTRARLDVPIAHPGCHITVAASDDEDDVVLAEPGCKVSDAQLNDLLHDCELRDYQADGVRYFVDMYDKGMSAILGDEMGLGKTLQTIAFMGYIRRFRREGGPHLVVCPLSVLSSWEAEFNRWLPSFRVKKLHCNEATRVAVLKEVSNITSYDVCITTYDMCKATHVPTRLKRIKFRTIVLDEGHCIKNELSIVSQTMRKLSCQFKILLTGTPLQNNMHELWALMNYLLPDVFSDPEPFDRTFDLHQRTVDEEMLDKAHHMLRPFMLRRLKSEVEVTLPSKKEVKVFVPMSEMQKFYYKGLLMRDQSALTSDGVGAYQRLNNLMMQLRKCCNHPFLFAGAEGPDPEETTAADIVAASGKMQVLQKLLKHLIAGGHRVVVFSQFTTVLDILEDWLEMLGVPYLKLSGKDNRMQRKIDIHMFNSPGSKYNIFLMSTRAGGMGINLQTADTVVLYDSDWNPQSDIQAMARVHRIGQKKEVHVYRLVTQGSIEERVLEYAERKLYMDQMVNRGSTKMADSLDKLGVKELQSMLRFGADAILSSEREDKQLTDEDIKALIARSDADDDDGRASAASDGAGAAAGADPRRSALNFDAAAPLPNINRFEGKVFSEGISVDEIGKMWNEGKRKRTSRVVMHGRDAVLKVDDYDKLGTNLSVFDCELSSAARAASAVPKKVKKLQINEEHCHNCWDGGDLVCCDFCPASYHVGCVGYETLDEFSTEWPSQFSCPHHECMECHRKSGEVGGIIFRCAVCPRAFCDDHMPETSVIIRHCQRYVDMGVPHPKQACYIICGKDCQEEANVRLPDEEHEHVSSAFDTCATAAARAEAASKMLDIEKLLEEGREAKKRFEIPALAPGAEYKADLAIVAEANRFTGGVLEGKRSTRNLSVSYKLEKPGQREVDDDFDDDALDDDDFNPDLFGDNDGGSYRASSTPVSTSTDADDSFSGAAEPSPTRLGYRRPSGHSGYKSWFSVNFNYFKMLRESSPDMDMQMFAAIVAQKWRELGSAGQAKWEQSADATKEMLRRQSSTYASAPLPSAATAAGAAGAAGAAAAAAPPTASAATPPTMAAAASAAATTPASAVPANQAPQVALTPGDVYSAQFGAVSGTPGGYKSWFSVNFNYFKMLRESSPDMDIQMFAAIVAQKWCELGSAGQVSWEQLSVHATREMLRRQSGTYAPAPLPPAAGAAAAADVDTTTTTSTTTSSSAAADAGAAAASAPRTASAPPPPLTTTAAAAAAATSPAYAVPAYQVPQFALAPGGVYSVQFGAVPGMPGQHFVNSFAPIGILPQMPLAGVIAPNAVATATAAVAAAVPGLSAPASAMAVPPAGGAAPRGSSPTAVDSSSSREGDAVAVGQAPGCAAGPGVETASVPASSATPSVAAAGAASAPAAPSPSAAAAAAVVPSPASDAPSFRDDASGRASVSTEVSFIEVTVLSDESDDDDNEEGAQAAPHVAPVQEEASASAAATAASAAAGGDSDKAAEPMEVDGAAPAIVHDGECLCGGNNCKLKPVWWCEVCGSKDQPVKVTFAEADACERGHAETAK